MSALCTRMSSCLFFLKDIIQSKMIILNIYSYKNWREGFSRMLTLPLCMQLKCIMLIIQYKFSQALKMTKSTIKVASVNHLLYKSSEDLEKAVGDERLSSSKNNKTHHESNLCNSCTYTFEVFWSYIIALCELRLNLSLFTKNLPLCHSSQKCFAYIETYSFFLKE